MLPPVCGNRYVLSSHHILLFIFLTVYRHLSAIFLDSRRRGLALRSSILTTRSSPTSHIRTNSVGLSRRRTVTSTTTTARRRSAFALLSQKVTRLIKFINADIHTSVSFGFFSYCASFHIVRFINLLGIGTTSRKETLHVENSVQTTFEFD
jgi:hypothetical protein